MKKIFEILAVSALFCVVSCNGGMRITTPESSEQQETQNDTDADTASSPDKGDTVPDDSDTTPVDGDTVPDGSNTTPVDGDTAPEYDGDTLPDDDETPDYDNSEEEVIDDEGVTVDYRCEELPENAEWNPAECILLIYGNPDFANYSTNPVYNEEPAKTTIVVMPEEPHNTTQVSCPEGTAPKNNECVECGRIIPGAYLEETDAGTIFIDKNGKTAIEQCFNEYNAESGTFKDSAKPCCGSGTLYRIKNGVQVELTQPYTYNGEALPNTVTGCSNSYTFEETTRKCYYSCNCGELKVEDGVVKCYIEYGNECRFKCKEGFNWNGNACI